MKSNTCPDCRVSQKRICWATLSAMTLSQFSRYSQFEFTYKRCSWPTGQVIDDATTWASSIFSGINFLMNSRFVNSVSNAINNISAHYDISNDMFASFLSKDMTYSCAIFESKDESLEIAQYRKLDRVIRQARINSRRSCPRNWLWMGKFCYSRSTKDRLQSHDSNIVYRTKGSCGRTNPSRRITRSELRSFYAIIENMSLLNHTIKLFQLK